MLPMHSIATQRGYGAMVARLTPDQKVGRSNRSGLIFLSCPTKAWMKQPERLAVSWWGVGETSQHKLCAKATPAGFEPARVEPIGLAGRRLNHSAKVSMLCCLTPATHTDVQCEVGLPGNSGQLIRATYFFWCVAPPGLRVRSDESDMSSPHINCAT